MTKPWVVRSKLDPALAREIQNFTGISDPYEPPESPEVLVRTDRESVEEGVARILETLRGRGLLEPA